MGFRDHLQKQIDQLGKVLAKVLADFLDLKDQEKIEEGIEMIRQSLITQLDLDIRQMMVIPDGGF